MNKFNIETATPTQVLRLLDGVMAMLAETPEDRMRRLIQRQVEERKQAAADMAALSQVAAVGRADQELYDDVIEALVAEGKAVHVAANLVNTQVKLLAEAKRLQII